MTPNRKAEIKTYAESVAHIHHGGDVNAAVILECLMEIDRLEEVVADLRKPMTVRPECIG